MPLSQLWGEGIPEKGKTMLSHVTSKPWSASKKGLEEKIGKGAFGKYDYYPVIAGDVKKPNTVKFGPKADNSKSLEAIGVTSMPAVIMVVKKGADPNVVLGVDAAGAPPPTPPAKAPPPAPPAKAAPPPAPPAPAPPPAAPKAPPPPPAAKAPPPPAPPATKAPPPAPAPAEDEAEVAEAAPPAAPPPAPPPAGAPKAGPPPPPPPGGSKGGAPPPPPGGSKGGAPPPPPAAPKSAPQAPPPPSGGAPPPPPAAGGAPPPPPAAGGAPPPPAAAKAPTAPPPPAAPKGAPPAAPPAAPAAPKAAPPPPAAPAPTAAAPPPPAPAKAAPPPAPTPAAARLDSTPRQGSLEVSRPPGAALSPLPEQRESPQGVPPSRAASRQPSMLQVQVDDQRPRRAADAPQPARAEGERGAALSRMDKAHADANVYATFMRKVQVEREAEKEAAARLLLQERIGLRQKMGELRQLQEELEVLRRECLSPSGVPRSVDALRVPQHPSLPRLRGPTPTADYSGSSVDEKFALARELSTRPLGGRGSAHYGEHGSPPQQADAVRTRMHELQEEMYRMQEELSRLQQSVAQAPPPQQQYHYAQPQPPPQQYQAQAPSPWQQQGSPTMAWQQQQYGYQPRAHAQYAASPPLPQPPRPCGPLGLSPGSPPGGLGAPPSDSSSSGTPSRWMYPGAARGQQDALAGGGAPNALSPHQQGGSKVERLARHIYSISSRGGVSEDDVNDAFVRVLQMRMVRDRALLAEMETTQVVQDLGVAATATPTARGTASVWRPEMTAEARSPPWDRYAARAARDGHLAG